MADSVVLTVDELRALRRVAELSLPGFVTAADTGAIAVDAAALRGLAARDLVRLTGRATLDAVRVADGLTRLLAPFSAAQLLGEIEIEAGGRLTHLACAAGADRSVTLLTERGVGLVSVERVKADDVGRLLALRCRLDEVTESTDEAWFTVDAQAQADADARALAGDEDAAVDTLTAAAVPRQIARAWIKAITGRRLAVAVVVARRLRDHPTGPYEAAELRWLVAGDGTAWRVQPGEPEPAEAAAYDDFGPSPTAVITTVGRAALGADLAALAGRPAPREVSNR